MRMVNSITNKLSSGLSNWANEWFVYRPKMYLKWFFEKQTEEDMRRKQWLECEENENIHWVHPSRWHWFMFKAVPQLVVMVLITIALVLFEHWAISIAYVLPISQLIKSHIERIQQYYVITEHSVVSKHGLFFRKYPNPIVKKRLQDYYKEFPKFYYSWLNYGHLTLKTAGTGDEEQRWERVPNPSKFTSKIQEYIRTGGETDTSSSSSSESESV